MPKIDLVTNGNFTLGTAGWSGTDLEISHSETAYISSGEAGNLVSELDGVRGETTVMQQTLTVAKPSSGTLSFDTAVRNAGTLGRDGFQLEILDSTGTAILSETILPGSNNMETLDFDVTFPAAGSYTLRFTEVGNDDSLGAIVDDVSLLVCFVAGTRLATPSGPRPVQDLAPGDLVQTEQGLQPVQWNGRTRIRHAALQANAKYRPVRIRANALGQGLPVRDLLVSRQHRMVIDNRVVRNMLGLPRVFLPAHRLAGLPGIAQVVPEGDVDYHHILLPRHAVVYAEHAPSESFLLGEQSLLSLSAQDHAQISARIPRAFDADGPLAAPVLPVPLGKTQRKLVQRMARNDVPALDLSHEKGPAPAMRA